MIVNDVAMIKSLKRWLFLLTLAFVVTSCTQNEPNEIANSAYPLAVNTKKVGSYPAMTKSGAGYFYDDVLEYRVWINPLEGGDDYYKAFSRYEDAEAYSKRTEGAEVPLVLVLQKEWIDEPEEGVFVPQKQDRITEWQVEWLADSKRTPDSIERFLKEHENPQRKK